MHWNQSPESLEQWYRADPEAFRAAFEAAPIPDEVGATWAARLAADRPQAVDRSGFPWAIAASLLIAVTLLTPYWASGDMDLEWAIPLLATFGLGPLLLFHGRKDMPVLAAAGGLAVVVAALWWMWEDVPSAWRVRQLVEAEPALEAAGERVNFMRQARDLMMIHWPMLLAGLTGLAFVRSRAGEERVDFVRHAVTVGILAALVLAAGGLLVGLTNALMEVLDFSHQITEAINIHLVIWGLSGALVFAHAVWLRHPQSLDRILPTLARIFIPLFVVLEALFLIALMADGFSSLADNREQLLIFNLLLAAVIGLILLHSAFEEDVPRWSHGLIVALAVLGVLADGVAIAAIASRLGEWGATPNRLTVLGGNLVFFGTLVALLARWGRQRGDSPMRATRDVLNRALAVFVLWSATVTVLVPVLYGFRVAGETQAQFESSTADTMPIEEVEE